MGEAARLGQPMTVEEFLEWDSGDEYLWELVDGYPQLKFLPDAEGHAAPVDEHGVIVHNLSVAIDHPIRANRMPCRIISGHGQPVDRTRYRMPDLVVRCGRTSREARDPILVVEVLSPSNSAVEMERRQRDYMSLPTLQEYVVIELGRPAAQSRRRRGDLWRFDQVEGLDAVLTLESVALSAPMRDVYRSVLWAEDDAPEA